MQKYENSINMKNVSKKSIKQGNRLQNFHNYIPWTVTVDQTEMYRAAENVQQAAWVHYLVVAHGHARESPCHSAQ